MFVSYLRIFFLVGLLPVALLSAANFFLDPYEIFQTHLFPDVGATQERYLKIELLKKNKTFDTFLFGGSRMGTTVPADIEAVLPGTHIYNFYVSSGNQTDNLVHGRWLLKTQPQLKTFYVQVDWPDSVGLTKANYQYWTHPEVLGNSTAGFLAQYLFLLPYQAIEFKLDNNGKRKGELKVPLSGGNYYYPKRDRDLKSDCAAYIQRNLSFLASVVAEVPSAEKRKMIDQSLGDLTQLVRDAEQKGVQVNLYITPHHHKFLDRISLDDYSYFLQKLAAIRPYWNFGIYSDITRNDCNYYEPSHYIGSVAPHLYRIMSKQLSEPDIAHYVTKENVAEELAYVRSNFLKNRNAASAQP